MTREIPLDFVKRYCTPTWREVSIGIREQWLRDSDAVTVAAERLMSGKETGSETADLASLLDGDAHEVREAIARLLQVNPGNTEDAARTSWLRVLLAWLYENRTSVTEPLRVVEQIYADFGYPREIRHLVGYNTPDDKTPVDTLGDEGLMRSWAKYVKENRLR